MGQPLIFSKASTIPSQGQTFDFKTRIFRILLRLSNLGRYYNDTIVANYVCISPEIAVAAVRKCGVLLIRQDIFYILQIKVQGILEGYFLSQIDKFKKKMCGQAM